MSLKYADQCPFCLENPSENEYWIRVVQLDTSKLCLNRDQSYRGHCFLIATVGAHIESLDDLTPTAYMSYMLELRASIAAVRAAFKPDHINVEFLGNVEPHLHAHIIPRYTTDARWGQPIWTTVIDSQEKIYLLSEEMTSMIKALRRSLPPNTVTM